MTWINISLDLSSDLPMWPGSQGFHLEQTHDIDKDGVENSVLHMDCHVGTHLDAPAHFVKGGARVEALSLEHLCGDAIVIDARGHPSIDVELLASRWPSETPVSRVLFRTDNSASWSEKNQVFNPNFVALTVEASRWLAEKNLALVGVDYLSIQRFGDSNETHTALLEKGTIALEGLNLHDVDEGKYELVCLPLLLVGAEGAPARAVIRPKKVSKP